MEVLVREVQWQIPCSFLWALVHCAKGQGGREAGVLEFMWDQLCKKALFSVCGFSSCPSSINTLSSWTPPMRCISYKDQWWRWVVDSFLSPIRTQEPLQGRCPRSSCRNSKGSGLDDAFFHLSPPTNLCASPQNASSSHSSLSAPNILYLYLSQNRSNTSTLCLWSPPSQQCIISAYLPKYGFHLSHMASHKPLVASYP